MNHDEQCELGSGRFCTHEGCVIDYYGHRGTHCHCGSRAYQLCAGCKKGQHLSHQDNGCACDLCEVAA